MSPTSRAGTPLSRRHWILALALGATVAACMWAAQLPDADSAELAEARPARRPLPTAAPATAQPAHWTPAPRQPWPEAEPAALGAWQPALPPPVQAPPPQQHQAQAAPPPPQAPPFPYQLIGRLVQAGRVQALLGSEQRSLAVQAGDTIDGQWRVQAIGDDSLELRWLPGPLPQTLRLKPL